ncbi:MAG TPA: NAD-dependent epimerase/dehydratase family protein [Candidatus Methylomirabilis sp.]|nr:NAD-dependent epimerase/dehydratase family protein [Candidatus Methylomirabilis sp.]
MYKNILVTGGAGFIGRETVEKLVRRGYNVVAFDLAEQFARHTDFFTELRDCGNLRLASGSILDRTALRSAIQGAEIVVHLAAMLGVRKTEDNRLGCLDININGTDNVLNACVMDGVRKIIFASSSEVYGEPSRNPIREIDETKGKTVYAVSKLAGEELVKGYHQLYRSLDYTIVRLFNTYGEGQVAQFVLARFVKNVLEGKNPVVYGNGTQTRSYGHVDDVTEGFLMIMGNSVSNGKTYNLGNSSQVMTLKGLAQKVIDVLAPGKGLQVEVLGTFDGSDRIPEREIHTRYCDTSLAAADLGYAPTITVEEGIRRIAEQGHVHADWPTV